MSRSRVALYQWSRLYGFDELWDRWRRSEISDPLSLHDVLDGVCVLDEGDDAHLCSTFGALQGVYLIDALYARGPTTSAKLTAIVALLFLG